MATLLMVRAHPLTSEFSRSMQLTDEFVDVYRTAHPDDDVVDVNLYNRAVPEIDIDLLSAWQKLAAGTPWNLQVPTRLKGWIDTISVPGRTFRYTADGMAVGLVQGKKAVHIQTSGGVFGGLDPASLYVRTVFTFLGVEDYTQVTAEGMDHDPEHAAEIVAAAQARVAEVAAAF